MGMRYETLWGAGGGGYQELTPGAREIEAETEKKGSGLACVWHLECPVRVQ